MNWTSFAIILLFFSGLLAVPVVDRNNSNEGLIRKARAPTFHKKRGHGGLLFGGGPSLGAGGNTYVTNINNFGPAAHHEPEHHGGHGPIGGTFAMSSASAGGHGPSSAQSQSASFSVGPFSASFSQSQAQSGEKRGGGIFDYFDY